MTHLKLLGLGLGAGICALAMSGCVSNQAEELYALPRQSDAYYALQSAMDQVLGADAAYSGPLSGSNQQAVQLADLDGDGQDEAIVYVKTSGEKPLKAYIFDSDENENYRNTAVIEGDGSAFDSVEYVQVDGKPGLEILVGRRISDQIVQSLGVYAYDGTGVTELMSANYTEYIAADLDGDEGRELLILRLETEDRAGTAALYRWRDGRMVQEPEALLSAGIRQIRRITTGYVASGVPAVFVASTYGEDTLVTDIFAFCGTEFCNIATDVESVFSSQTVRSFNVYASDIDSDGLIELPSLVALPSDAAEDETYWAIDWYNLSLDGQRKRKMMTYHCYPGGWYLELPETWYEHLTVSRSEETDGVRGYTFSKWNGRGAKIEEIVTIYAFTGDDRLTLAQADGRFLLAEKGETAYAASLGTCSWAGELNQEKLNQIFHLIQVDWNSGEI